MYAPLHQSRVSQRSRLGTRVKRTRYGRSGFYDEDAVMDEIRGGATMAKAFDVYWDYGLRIHGYYNDFNVAY